MNLKKLVLKMVRIIIWNILIYHISSKTLSVPKPLRMILDQVDGFVRVYNRVVVPIYNRVIFIGSLLQGKEVVLHMFFPIIMQKSKSIHMFPYL